MRGDDGNTILIQIARMRERADQLCKSATGYYGLNSAISIRLQMVHNEITALENDLRAANPIDGQGQRAHLSKAQMEEIAAMIAERLGKMITVIYDDVPLQIVPTQSKKPS